MIPPEHSTGTTRAPHSFIQRLLVFVLIAALSLLAWRLSDLIVVLFGAIVVAIMLTSFARLFERFARVGPSWSVPLAILVGVAALGGLIWSMGNPLAEQIGFLRERLPAAIEALTDWLDGHPAGQAALDWWKSVEAADLPWTRLAGFASMTFGALGMAGLIIVMGIYLAVAPRLYRNGFLRLVPIAYRAKIGEALRACTHGLRQWLLGQAISMLFVGFATAIGLASLGVPLAVPVGLISGLLAFVPFFGALAGGLFAVLMAFVEGPQTALYVLILCVAIQQIEGHVLMPLVQRWAVQLPPVLGLGATLIFGLLFGLMGVLFATPMMVVVMILTQRLYVEGYLERAGHERLHPAT